MELDYACRLKRCGDVSAEKKLVLIWPKSPIANVFKNAYAGPDIKIIISGILHLLMYPLLLRYKYLTFDVSLSNWNHHANLDEPYFCSHQELYDKYRNWFTLIQKTKGFFPVKYLHKNHKSSDLKEFIGNTRYIIIQIKDVAVNASFLTTDPQSYLPVIQQMRHQGYQVVFAGRERMPSMFSEYGVLNYSESSLATASNDYYLVRDATAVLASGSGFAMIADVMGIPLLTVNCWNFLWCGGERSIVIPSLLSLHGTAMTFLQQHELAETVGPCATAVNDSGDYTCYDASPKEIYEAWQELLSTNPQRLVDDSELQVNFKKIFHAKAPLRAASSIVANSYLKNHLNRF
jgi:putative glycosyltransferase (TIGR04372 family)